VSDITDDARDFDAAITNDFLAVADMGRLSELGAHRCIKLHGYARSLVAGCGSVA
jgi:hypothetical protein